MSKRVRDAKEYALGVTNAQEVFQDLDSIFDHRASLGTRWVWELLQNARDAANPSGAGVSIELSDTHLSFRHDGKPFAPEEIVHLIFHGSTKYESETAIGQFGSGFITTHLLSRRVTICGALEEGNCFQFQLDRSGETVNELREAMEQSFSEFEQAEEKGAALPSGSDTLFRFELNEDAFSLAKSGIAQLQLCAPLVLAFSPEIVAIQVKTRDGEWSVRRQKWESKDSNDVAVLPIESIVDGNSSVSFVVCVMDDGLPLLATILKRMNEHQALSFDLNIPRLFIQFPLLGTDRLNLPVAVNSTRFKPKDDRDGIVMEGDSVGVIENRRVLSRAIQLVENILKYAEDGRWLGMESVLSLDPSQAPEWLGRTWFADRLRPLVNTVRSTKLVVTATGEYLAPQDSWIPCAQTPEDSNALLHLASGLKGSAGRLPQAHAAQTWSGNLRSWSTLTMVQIEKFQEAFTVRRLAEIVNGVGSIAGLQQVLLDPERTIDWLGQFLELIEHSNQTGLFDEFALLPNQNMRLRKRQQLRIDGGIDEELKNIGEGLNVRLRDMLLDLRIHSERIRSVLEVKKQTDALDDVVRALENLSRGDTLAIQFVQPNSDLFWWICSHERHRLDKFPVATAEISASSATIVTLLRSTKVSERPLAPVIMWPLLAQRYAELFPEQKILHPLFAAGLRSQMDWRSLFDDRVLHSSPIIVTRQYVDKFLRDEHIEEDQPERHRSKSEMEVSEIAFLSERNIGLMDRMRKSRKKAIQFVSFLADVGIVEDAGAFQRLSAGCDCGETHQYYRGAWIATTRDRVWIPIDSEERIACRPTADALAQLLEEAPELVKRLSAQDGLQLLQALEISAGDFVLRTIAPDEESRVSLVQSVNAISQAVGGDVQMVAAFAAEIAAHPEQMQRVQEEKERREKIQRNRNIGKLVEDLLKEEFTDHKLLVKRTGMGSDFEVESDFIDNDEEILLQIGEDTASVLIEIKSTRGDTVKMTPLQAKTACAEGARFALCVVALGDEEPTRDLVRQKSHFVFGIGKDVIPVWEQFRKIQISAQTARSHKGPIELDMVDGQYRFKVGQQVWLSGLSFEEAVMEVRQRSGTGG